jgi:hypothetical protein
LKNNTFGYIEGTFTLTKTPDGSPMTEHRVGPFTTNTPIRTHKYYQWVPFFLFFLALTFSIGHLTWKQLEGGNLKKTLAGVHIMPFSVIDVSVGIN